MINFTIIMPFSRAHNADAIKASLAAATEGMEGKVQILAVCLDKSLVPIFDDCILTLPVPAWDICYAKMNQALNQLNPKSKEYVGFICDDDCYEPKFFTELERLLVGPVLPRVAVVNMKRWFHGPAVVDELTAIPEKMAVGHVGLEQFYIRSDIMNLYQFNNYSHGDGDLMERMFAGMPHDFAFFPQLFVNWNHLPK